ncbi:MAG TPA: hypothetical protein PKC30_03940 [Saprospiraceae bacterium]|nr:hypothetical protein [Saprospiraceae bacterium]
MSLHFLNLRFSSLLELISPGKMVIFAIACPLLFGMCQLRSSQAHDELGNEESIVILPKDFIEFYDHFHRDSLYQMEHIVFPLKGKGDSNNAGMEAQWSEEEWQLHRHFLEEGNYFEKEYAVLPSLIIEVISDPSKTYTIERRWAKLVDGWNLIYYKSLDD